MNTDVAGIGGSEYRLAVYIANRPPLPPYADLQRIRPLQPGEVAQIVAGCGNHWRKIFNLLAKLTFALNPQGMDSWQQYRDQLLLQAAADHALIFGGLQLQRADTLHIIAGKTYARQLWQERTCSAAQESTELLAVDADFSVALDSRLIVAPYLDYRQLSNVRLERLLELIETCSR